MLKNQFLPLSKRLGIYWKVHNFGRSFAGMNREMLSEQLTTISFNTQSYPSTSSTPISLLFKDSSTCTISTNENSKTDKHNIIIDSFVCIRGLQQRRVPIVVCLLIFCPQKFEHPKSSSRQLLTAIRRKPSEDQIEIGEELLRKLTLEHQQTHHENQPQKEKIQAIPLGVSIKPTHQNQHYLPQHEMRQKEFVEKPISYDLQSLNYHHITYPFAYYYMPPPYHLPYVIGWCPLEKNKNSCFGAVSK